MGSFLFTRAERHRVLKWARFVFRIFITRAGRLRVLRCRWFVFVFVVVGVQLCAVRSSYVTVLYRQNGQRLPGLFV